MDIHEFVISEYGPEVGTLINDRQQKIFQAVCNDTRNKSANQMNTLVNTILPRIALYRALIEMHYEKTEAYSKVKKYLDEIVGRQMNDQLKSAEKIPGFFALFRNKMYKEVTSSDNWDVEVIENTKTAIRYNIKRCLWFDACKENGCAELCQIFCDVDHIIYGNMNKVSFTRNGTIGKGQAYCDFCYRRK